MPLSQELAELFRRDLTRLIQEIQAFSDERALWNRTGGITNTAGNLALHLEGNLREYVGRQLGGILYVRTRALEFSSSGIPQSELIARLQQVRDMVPAVVSNLDSGALDADYPELVLGTALSTRQFVLHLLAHLNYHLGQIDYARRVLTGQTALSFAGL